MGTAINLSAASATNLLALQRTTAAINRTQERLATGLKVNSAVDNSVAFFDAATLTGRATALQLLKDDIDQAVSAVQSAVDGIEAIEALTLGSNVSVIALRVDFADTLKNVLQEGAGKLVNADLNLESANLLTLQTRLQLGTIGLSIAQQSDQAVFRLF